MLTRSWIAPVLIGMNTANSAMAGHRDAPAADTEAGGEQWETADERTLVEACLAGRAGAFDVVVSRYRRQVYQLCYRFVANHEDASDLAQDVFIRAYRGLRGFKSRASLSTWLYRMALKTPRAEALEHREQPDHGVERPDAALLRAERAAEVRAAIARLPRKQRATLILRVYHELPHHEIADILGSSVGAVKANFFHALANMKKLLQ